LNEHQKPLKGSKVLILGTAYKPDVDDLRESPALDIIGLLEQKGAIVSFHDPHISKIRQDEREMESVSDLMEAVRSVDCVVIITNHSSYNYPAILNEAGLIVDTRNALGDLGKNNPKVSRL